MVAKRYEDTFHYAHSQLRIAMDGLKRAVIWEILRLAVRIRRLLTRCRGGKA